MVDKNMYAIAKCELGVIERAYAFGLSNSLSRYFVHRNQLGEMKTSYLSLVYGIPLSPHNFAVSCPTRASLQSQKAVTEDIVFDRLITTGIC